MRIVRPLSLLLWIACHAEPQSSGPPPGDGGLGGGAGSQGGGQAGASAGGQGGGATSPGGGVAGAGGSGAGGAGSAGGAMGTGGGQDTNCRGDEHLCMGRCVSNHSVDHCGAWCTPCPSPSYGRATCVAETCGVQCNTGFHLCGLRCVSDTDVNTCGSSCTPCAPVPGGTARCDGTRCVAQCDPGTCNVVGGCASWLKHQTGLRAPVPDFVVFAGQVIHVAFRDAQGIHHSSSNDGTLFTSPVLVMAGGSGINYLAPSIAVSSSGQVGIAVIDLGTTTSRVRYAKKSGSSWAVETAATAPGLTEVDLAFDSSANPHLVFRAGQVIKYLARTGTSWAAPITVSSTSVGPGPGLAVEGTQPLVAYWKSAPSGTALNLATLAAGAFASTTRFTASSSPVDHHLAVNSAGVASVAIRDNGSLYLLRGAATNAVLAASGLYGPYPISLTFNGTSAVMGGHNHDPSTLGSISEMLLVTAAGTSFSTTRLGGAPAVAVVHNGDPNLIGPEGNGYEVVVTRRCTP